MIVSSQSKALVDALRRRRKPLRQDAMSVLEAIKTQTVMHRHFENAYNGIFNAITLAESSDIFVVPGVSGAGKTSVLGAFRYEMLDCPEAREAADGKVPCVFIEAPKFKKDFRCRGLWISILRALGDPLTYRMKHSRAADVDDLVRRFVRHPDSSARVSDDKLKASAIEACLLFGVKYIFIDEGNHLVRVRSADVVEDILEEIKAFANMTGVIIVILGTYRMSPMFNSNAQIVRRTEDMQVSRYIENRTLFLKDEESEELIDVEMEAWASILETYQEILAPIHAPPLNEYFSLTLEGSVGIFGELKKWLARWVRNYGTGVEQRLSVEALIRARKKPIQLKTMREEAEDGETVFAGLLHPDEEQQQSATSTGESVNKRNSKTRPGKRKPVRDDVGPD